MKTDSGNSREDLPWRTNGTTDNTDMKSLGIKEARQKHLQGFKILGVRELLVAILRHYGWWKGITAHLVQLMSLKRHLRVAKELEHTYSSDGTTCRVNGSSDSS